LKEAIEEFENSRLMKKTLGERVHGLYLKAKKKEWEEYNKQIHNWELKSYLTAY